jgi:hypothetical protein
MSHLPSRFQEGFGKAGSLVTRQVLRKRRQSPGARLRITDHGGTDDFGTQHVRATRLRQSWNKFMQNVGAVVVIDDPFDGFEARDCDIWRHL